MYSKVTPYNFIYKWKNKNIKQLYIFVFNEYILHYLILGNFLNHVSSNNVQFFSSFPKMDELRSSNGTFK